MRLLDPTWVRDNVDYSFGDDSGTGVPGGYMKIANSSNAEFILAYHQAVTDQKPYMTVFIDNIRLYRRDCMKYTACEQMYDNWKVIKINKIIRLANEDLLALLSTLTDMKFIIFTGFEDTPTDEAIFDLIPKNVIGIWASNAITFGRKVYPIAYGIQRVVSPIDNRHNILREMIDINIQPNKLMYVNMSPSNNQVRPGLISQYTNLSWTTITIPINNHLPQYRNYLTDIKSHKFMICPPGNAEDCECHRDWETIYMRRVPIVTDTPYHRAIFEPLEVPVLYVNDLMEITEQLLIDNDYLYQQTQEYDLRRLDYEVIYNNIIEKIEKQINIII